MPLPTRLFDLVDLQDNLSPNPKAINAKRDGSWIHYSQADFKRLSDEYALALYHAGIVRGDRVAIISTNCPEWNFCDNGIQKAGAICVPIYPTSSLADFQYILHNAEVRIAFVSDKSLYDKILSVQKDVPSLEAIYCFDQIEGVAHVSSFLSQADWSQLPKIEDIKSQIKTHDLATIIYTSGTTGNPKGVMLSHRNILFNIECVAGEIPLARGQNVLSFLPLSHIFERVATYVYFSEGVSLYYAESLDTLKENILEVKPIFFTCVPRLMEKIHAGMLAKIQELSGFQKIIYQAAIRCAHKENAKSDLLYSLYDRLVFSKWRAALGGNLRGIITGAAALQPRLDTFFNNIGITVRQAYGMTEAAPGIAMNRFTPDGNKSGTVGPLLKNVELKLLHREGMNDDEGEILIRGENIMIGYYKNQEATDATIHDGWLLTGDVGKLVDGRYLQLTDRVKELFKTSGGKYVAPQYLENKLKENKYIEQLIVIGNERKFVSAIIYPNIPNLKSWAEYKKYTIDFQNPNWIENPLVIDKIRRVIDRYNEQFSQIEKIKQFRLINQEWTIDSGELTPTLKLKRKVIEAKYKQVIDDIYKD